MSLLGRQVYANPTTPIWGQGGGGGTIIPYGTPLTFNGPGNDPTLLEMNADAVLGVVDASANYASFQTGDLRVYGAGEGGGSFINFGTGFGGSNAPLGIRAVYDDGTLQNTLAEFTSGGWDLSNVSTINGSNYPPGGGGGSNFQTLNITQTGGNAGELNFYKDVSGTSFAQLQMYPNPASVVGSQVLSVYDASGLADTLQVGDLQAAGTGTLPGGEPPALSLGMAGTGTLGLRLVDTDVGGVINTYATFASNAFDLSNVSSINGVPYFNSPGTQFDYRNYPGGSPLVEAPDWGVLNAISFTAPVDGKVYVESLATYVALVAGGGVSMTFAVDGTNISETPTTINAYAGNTNLFGTSMFQFPVSANVVYDISSIAHCSAIPPSDPDVVITSSRMFLLFSPQ